MNRNILPITLVSLSVLILGSCVSNKKFQALEDEKNQLMASVETLQKEVKDLQAQNEDIAQMNSELKSNLSEVESELGETKTRMEEVEMDAAKKTQKLNQLTAAVDEAFSELKETNTKVKDIEGVLYLDLADDINFRTASASLGAEDQAAIETLAKMLKERPGMQLVIEGNADKRPINNENYKNNWELSSARSLAVVEKLIAMGVNPEQLTVAGRAHYNPAVKEDPDTKETMEKNRRVEVMVVPKLGKLYKESGS